MGPGLRHTPGLSARRKQAQPRIVLDVTHEDALEDGANLDADLDALRAKPALRPGPRCGTAAAIERIRAQRPDRAEAVEKAVNDPDVPQGEVAIFLTKHGGKLIKAAAVGYHRRRGTVYGCSCNG